MNYLKLGIVAAGGWLAYTILSGGSADPSSAVAAINAYFKSKYVPSTVKLEVNSSGKLQLTFGSGVISDANFQANVKYYGAADGVYRSFVAILDQGAVTPSTFGDQTNALAGPYFAQMKSDLRTLLGARDF
jgi:hypothetical protein